MSEMKKVKLLIHGTTFGKMGDVVEVPAHIAEYMIKERDHHDGYSLKKIRVAQDADEAQAEADAALGKAPDLSNMSQGEADALGIKNITRSDPDDIGEVNKQATKASKAKAKK